MCHAVFLEELQAKSLSASNDPQGSGQADANGPNYWLNPVKQQDLSVGMLFKCIPLIQKAASIPSLCNQAVTCLARLALVSASVQACRALHAQVYARPGGVSSSNDVIALADVLQVYGQQLATSEDPEMDSAMPDTEEHSGVSDTLFAALSDDSLCSSALLCISRLALNGLLKVRPEGLSQLARLCVSGEEGAEVKRKTGKRGDDECSTDKASHMRSGLVSSLAQVFFRELAGKDSSQTIYNLLPHIIFNSTHDELCGGDAQVIRFLSSFLQRV